MENVFIQWKTLNTVALTTYGDCAFMPPLLFGDNQKELSQKRSSHGSGHQRDFYNEVSGCGSRCRSRHAAAIVAVSLTGRSCKTVSVHDNLQYTTHFKENHYSLRGSARITRETVKRQSTAYAYCVVGLHLMIYLIVYVHTQYLLWYHLSHIGTVKRKLTYRKRNNNIMWKKIEY